MDKAYKYAKSAIVNFKLDTCCCFAPIRIGLLIVGYFNLFVAVLSLIGTADGGIFTPPLMEVQDSLLEDEEVSVSAGIIAYAVELGFSAVLLCGMYRSDTALLGVYIYFLMVQAVTSVLMYSMVIAKVSTITKITIISNIVFNCYVIILVRSAVVEIKEQLSSAKNGHVVLYSVSTVPNEDEKETVTIEPAPPAPKTIDNELVREPSEHDKETNVEVITEEIKKEDKIEDKSKTGKVDESHVKSKTGKVEESKSKLETVNENLKEERSVH